MRNLRLLFTTLVLCLPVSLFAAAPLTDFVAGVNNLKLGPEAAAVSNATWTVGHMKVRLASGSIARVMAGNEPIGVFFKGNGSFDYETVEAAELPVVEHNVKAIAHLKMTADAQHATLSDDFTEILIVGGGVTMPAVTESGGAALADAFAQHMAFFGRARVTPLAHILAVQKFSFPTAKRLRIEIRGGRDNLLYDLDEAEDHDESLVTIAGPTQFVSDKRVKDWLFPNVLSDQPVGRDHWTTARPPFALTGLDYTFTADDDNAKADVTETIARLAPGQNVLRFDMQSERIVRANQLARTYHVRSVTDVQGRALPFHHDMDDLVVAVDAATDPTLKIKFAIEGDFLVREGGDNAWQLRLGEAWFPLPRQLAGQAYTVHSVLRIKKPFIGIAPGNTVSRRDEGDYNVVENVLDKPVEFTMVEGGKYNLSEEKRGERTIRVATYGLRNDRASKQLTNLAFDFIEYYELFLGPFPWKEFNIIQVNTYGYGQAPPATMFITNEAFNSMLSSVDEDAVSADQFFSQGINERFAHEIAHQYWGYVVRDPSPEETWLAESFAEYSAALALKKLMPNGEGIYNRLVSKWRAGARQATAVAPIPYANRIEGDPSLSFRQRFGLLYEKGPYLLYALHKEVGDTTFLTFLKSYQKSFAFKAGSTKDVAGLLGFITKKDYRPFFDQYFWGTAMPQ
ncbi:MAG TPA: M1 family aminopeptidase [Thermoanaerobaculia bacterium]|jgi:hypothetical protein|nr:M1 family aminopeptidase [Thermoanaerobaculia bacterium]